MEYESNIHDGDVVFYQLSKNKTYLNQEIYCQIFPKTLQIVCEYFQYNGGVEFEKQFLYLCNPQGYVQ